MGMLQRIIKGIVYSISLPKSFIASCKLTSLKQAFDLPVLLRYNVKLIHVSGKLKGCGRLSMGFNTTDIYDEKHQRSILSVAGTIEIDGAVSMGAGSRLYVGKNATLHFNGNISNSADVTIVCEEKIYIGNNTVISWKTLIMDTDYHYVYDIEENRTRLKQKPIVIGESAWLCAGSMVLKGAVLPNGCILSAGSVLNGQYDEPNCILQGNPAVVTRRNVTRRDNPVYSVKDHNNE